MNILNNRNSQDTTTKKSFDDRAYDLLGDMIALRAGEIIENQLKEDELAGNTQKMDAFFEKFDAQNQKNIKRYFRRKKYKSFIRNTMPKASKRVAAFLGAVFLAGSVAVATSQTFRIRVLELLYSVEEEYTSVKLQENTNVFFEIPVDWSGDNYPSFLPEGLEIARILNGPDSHTVQYVISDTMQNYLYFSENGENTEMNIDTEGATVRSVLIRGNLGFISIKEKRISIVWTNTKKFFSLTLFDDDEELALKIASSTISLK